MIFKERGEKPNDLPFIFTSDCSFQLKERRWPVARRYNTEFNVRVS